MLSKNQEKLITSLSKKKFRDKTGLFLAESPKLVSDLIESNLKPYLIIADKSWQLPDNYKFETELVIVNENELKKISLLKTPQNVIAIFYQPQNKPITFSDSLIIGLDGIQDPGNFGTILRIADWFGINEVVCNIDTVDLYNPKVVQASMGSIARVNVQYVNLEEFCTNYLKTGNTIYGTFMKGENIYSTKLQKKGLIIFGNEGNGIRPEIEKKVSRKISIPSFSTNKFTSESLNVSVAAAIICSEFKRGG